MHAQLPGITLANFKAAYTNMVGARPTRRLLQQASRELLMPVIQRTVQVSGEVNREAALLMGQLNIQLMKLPVSLSLAGGKEGSINGNKDLNEPRLGGLTWVGDARTENQDSILFAVDRRTEGGEKVLMLVGDGMGGAKGGNIASDHVLTKIGTAFTDGEGEFGLPSAIVASSDAIRAEIAADQVNLEGAGTTLVAALIEPAKDQATLVNVGDSRFYLLRGGKLWILTQDDNLLNLQDPPKGPFPLGGETARAYYEKMRTALGNNIITRSIGQSELKEADLAPITLELKEGDLLIGACDGLNALAWEKLEGTLAANQAKTPKEISEELKTALAGLATDNVTVGIYRHTKEAVKATAKPAYEPDTSIDDFSGRMTGKWDAAPDVKANLIEQATRALEIPAELAEQFARLVDESAEYRELAMRDAKLALQRTEERDAAKKESGGLRERVAALEASLAAVEDKTRSVQPTGDLQVMLELALAQWHEIKLALDTNAERADTAEAKRTVQEPLVERSRALIASEIEPIEAEARAAETEHLARKARITGQMLADLAKLTEQKEAAKSVALRELAGTAAAEQSALIAATEKEMDEDNRQTIERIRAKKDQSPFPRLRDHLAAQEAKLREAEEMLAQLARERAAIIEQRLQPLRDRLAEYEATAAAVQDEIAAIKRLMAEAKIG